jgi:hypothetical protein
MVQQSSFSFYFNTRQHALQEASGHSSRWRCQFFLVCFKKSILAPHLEPERLGWPKRISIPMRQRD